MSVYLVRGDPVVIDSLLADVWPGRARRALRLLVVDTTQDRVGLHDYAQALGRLLGAEVISATCDDAPSEDWPGPLRKLLLVIQSDDDPAGPAALACAVRLARLSGATVTVLAVVPPGPENGLATLLTTESTAVGQAAQQLVEAGIAATLRLRQGALDCQLHREVIETDYDLVLVGSKPILALGSHSVGDMQSRSRPKGVP
jgi:nucleotide-binding universal stress UspA family protein